MDFFDPEKQRRHAIRMGIGYAFIAIALALATTILLYQAYGFGINKNGQIFQNGLVFINSQPHSATIYVNNTRYKSLTNTRMALPAGQYTVQISLSGYRTWQRAINVEGGSVERFDYPFLFPSKLTTTTTQTYTSAPSFTTQSTDNHWLLVDPSPTTDFDLYDLTTSKPTPKDVAVPSTALAANTTTTGWRVVAWAGDNQHVLLHRTYQGQQDSGITGSEYILLDVKDPTQSQNLTQLLNAGNDSIAFRNLNYNEYYLFDTTADVLSTASTKDPTPVAYLTNVINYVADGNMVLYATASGAPANKVLVRIRQNTNTAYTIRTLGANTTYLLNLANYNGTEYAVVGAQNQNEVYVYQNPLSALANSSQTAVAPIEIMKITNPTYTDFSPNGRFALAENAGSVETYDLENNNAYAYQVKTSFDAPQVHVNWMDGYHIDVVSNGKVLVFDFDGANMQSLEAADATFVPAFDPSYHFIYTLNAVHTLTSTSLLAQ